MAELSSTKIYGDLDVAGDVKVASTSIMTKLNSFSDNTVVYGGVTIVTSTTIVDVFLYNTANDSDGGAWITKCQSKSWYNEPLNTATRGKTREFPAVALIVSEALKVTIYDATRDGCPMWMVFNATGTWPVIGMIGPGSSNSVAGIAMVNGVMCVGHNSGNYGVNIVDFNKDNNRFIFMTSTGEWLSNSTILNRNTASTGTTIDANKRVNEATAYSIAMTVIPVAPVDALTGLPVPTIIVGTGNGVSIIDGYAGVGTVVDDVFNTNYVIYDVSAENGQLIYTATNAWFSAHLKNFLSDYNAAGSTSNWKLNRDGACYYNVATNNYTLPPTLKTSTLGAKAAIAGKAMGGVPGVTLLSENIESYVDGMTAHINKDYNTGWMKGDIRRAVFCDALGTTDTVGAQLVTAWTNYSAGGQPYETFTSSVYNITSAINTIGNAYAVTNALGMVVGKRYRIAVNVVNNGGELPYIAIGTSTIGNGSDRSPIQTVAGYQVFDFTHTTSTEDYFWVSSIGASNFSVSVLVNESAYDRSPKEANLGIVNSLSRMPVATGAELQKYYGFTSTSYLAQSYAADLDFGTGDFYIMGWLDANTSTTTQGILSRDSFNGSVWSGGSISVQILAAGTIILYISDDGYTTYDYVSSTTIVPGVGKPILFCAVRRGSMLEMWINGVKESETSIIQATLGVSNNNATLVIGQFGGSSPFTNGYMSLIRMGAGNISAAQIAEVYRTEYQMFQPGVKCTLQGTQSNVNCLSYDKRYNALVVGTQDGSVTFRDLVIDGDYYAKTGVIRNVSANEGMVLEVTSTLVRYTGASNSFDNRMSPELYTINTDKAKLTSFVDNTIVYNGVTITTSSTIVDSFVYNTADDSDGGAWRLRCQDKSWYNEPLNTARRGKTREFPAVVLIVVEVGKATIYDATQDSFPMWMVLSSVGSTTTTGLGIFRGLLSTLPLSSCSAINGKMVFGINPTTGNNNAGVHGFDFVADTAFKYGVSSAYIGEVYPMVNYKTTNINANMTTKYPLILDTIVNDVAMTVIPGATVDSVTGLPVPTIAVAMWNGVSVIDGYAGVGTSVDEVYTGTPTAFSISIEGDVLTYVLTNAFLRRLLSGMLTDSSAGGVGGWEAVATGNKIYYNASTSAYSFPSTLPLTTLSAKSAVSTKALGCTAGITLVKEDTVPANGMSAHITKDYNTGWMKGDCRRALVCDALGTSRTIGTNLVSSWTPYIPATFNYETFTSSGANITSAINTTDSGYGSTNQLNMVLGMYYTITVNLTLNSGAVPSISIGSVTDASTQDFSSVLAAGVNTFTFKHNTAAQDYLWIYSTTGASNFSATFTIIEAVADRSAKSTTFTTTGSIAVNPVAFGSELQWISNFSASNYISQPYSADLDFGTGDFYVSLWCYLTSVTGFNMFVDRRSGGTTGFAVYTNGTVLSILIGSNTAVNATFTAAINTLYKIDCYRSSGVAYIYVNGTLVGSGSAPLTADATSILKIGDISYGTGYPLRGNISLIRIGAGTLSASQIAEAYRTEFPMFQINAKCTLQGTTSAVNCLAYDDRYNALVVGTTDGAATFRDLVIDGDYYAKTGNVKSVSADDGMVLETNTTLARFTAASNSFDGRLSGGVVGGVSTGSTSTTNSYKITGATTLVAGNEYMLDTSAGSFTVTLPLTANVDDKIVIYDLMGTFDTNSPIVARNGHVIMGLAENVTLDLENSKTELVYSGVTNGWRLYIVANLAPTENKLINMDATGLSTIVLDAEKYDVFNISNLTTGDTLDVSSIPVGKTIMVTLNAPGAITIAFSETVKWPNGTAPTHGSGWEVMVFTRVSSTVLLGSATLAHA